MPRFYGRPSLIYGQRQPRLKCENHLMHVTPGIHPASSRNPVLAFPLGGRSVLERIYRASPLIADPLPRASRVHESNEGARRARSGAGA